jgi:hypothetical protein
MSIDEILDSNNGFYDQQNDTISVEADFTADSLKETS